MDILHFQMYVVVNALDLEKAIGNFFKYGLITIAVFIGLAIVLKTVEFFYYISVETKMDKHGVRKVEILDANYVKKDDTLDRAGFGYMIAGERGWLLGAMMGEKYDELKSITFMIYYKNRTEEKVTISPKHRLCQELLKKAD